MALHRSGRLAREFSELRYEPTPKRVRAIAGTTTVADSRRAVLVWEPKRVVPSYAVPAEDLVATLEDAPGSEAPEHLVPLGPGSPGVLDPRTAFAAHTCEGTPVTLRVAGHALAGAGFRPADPDLAGYVVLDFAAFDQWFEESEPIVAHPRDPFSRIDVRRTADRVQVLLDDTVLADSTGALMLFETLITPRFYLPPSDVRMDLLTASPTTSACAYKGVATYFTAHVGGRAHPDVAWTYRRPLPGVTEIADHVCFFDERVDIVLGGVPRPRPVTPWS
ncbi:DUF427 domain-containing protein [Prauserella cavernicola]|uniref:DUF427 domain-containing protein n=1 Tax=Prauserella cavernicola TaxID=2800127 RepID=A0A934QP78_9PSEU|nr:DUF427 domain-containing protein [Prauserella cavernicola]MBK1782978.1 DUF427 domain-containing protein [Prauserella cavernicola]